MRAKLKTARRILQSLRELKPRRPESDPYHRTFSEFLARLRTKGSGMPSILEIGSRNVSGNTVRDAFDFGRYRGFDIHSGPNVDVVGDAHRLSTYFEPNTFDAIASVSVFEHLCFPWKVAMEINNVLKPGGLVFVGTHPNWPTHELPWDFFRFQKGGLAVLFSRVTGFRVVSLWEGIPARVIPLVLSKSLALLPTQQLNLGVALIAEKIGPVDDRLRWDVEVSDVLDTCYPRQDAT